MFLFIAIFIILIVKNKNTIYNIYNITFNEATNSNDNEHIETINDTNSVINNSGYEVEVENESENEEEFDTQYNTIPNTIPNTINENDTISPESRSASDYNNLVNSTNYYDAEYEPVHTYEVVQ